MRFGAGRPWKRKSVWRCPDGELHQQGKRTSLLGRLRDGTVNGQPTRCARCLRSGLRYFYSQVRCRVEVPLSFPWIALTFPSNQSSLAGSAAAGGKNDGVGTCQSPGH